METNKAIEKIIFDIYDYFYKHGQYGALGVSQTCLFLRNLYSNKQFLNGEIENNQNSVHYIFEELPKNIFSLKLYQNTPFEEYIYNLSHFKITDEIYKNIANSIKKLAEREITKSDALPTDDFCTKVMQIFANKISREKRFVDPCVGTGKLLIGLDSNDLLGLENDDNYVEIAKANLFFSLGNKDIDDYIKHENGLEYVGNKSSIYTYIFDPPLNVSYNIDSIPHYDSLIHQYNYYKTKTIPSEYVFLNSVLHSKKSAVYQASSNIDYICTFVSSFLTLTNEKFKMYFRELLIQNSLQVIISNPIDNKSTNKIILVGQQGEIKKDYLYLVTPKTKNITSEQLEKIADICINDKFEQYNEKEFFEIAKIKRVLKSELAGKNYVINMPLYEQGEKYVEIKSIPEVIESLENSNSKLKKSSDNLLELLNNLKRGIKNQDELPQELPKIVETKRKNKILDLSEKYGRKFNTKKKIININLSEEQNEPKLVIDTIDYLLKQNKLLTRSKRHFICKESIKNQKKYKNFVEYVQALANKELMKLSDEQQKFYEELITYYYNNIKYKNKKQEDPLSKYCDNDIYINLSLLDIMGIIKKDHNKTVRDYQNIGQIIDSYNLLYNITMAERGLDNEN